MSNALPTSVLVLLSSSLRSFALRGEAFLVRTRCCLLCARLTTYCTRTYLLFLSLSLSFFLSSFFARSYLRNVVDAHASLAVINAIIISTKRSYRPAVFSSSTVVFLVPICAAIELCHSREDPPLSRVSQFLSLSLSREKKRRTKLSRGIIISLPSFLHSDLVFRRMEGRRRERIHHVAKRRRVAAFSASTHRGFTGPLSVDLLLARVLFRICRGGFHQRRFHAGLSIDFSIT